MTASIRNNRTKEILKDGFNNSYDAFTHMWRNGISESTFYIHDDSWREREAARDNLLDLAEFGLPPIEDHFLHFASNDDGVGPIMVSYTESEDKGARDRQASPTRIGSYITRFYKHLSSDDVTALVGRIQAKHRTIVIKFAKTAEEISDVYIRCHRWASVQSCMTGDGRWRSVERDGFHPVDAYGDSDLQLAYIEKDDQIIARSIVWPEKKIHSRVYGQFEKLQPLFKELGYTSGSLEGAKLRKIPVPSMNNRDREVYVCPYLDGPHYVRVHDDHLEISVSGDDTQGTGTDGYVLFPIYTCSISGERIPRTEVVTLTHPRSGEQIYINRRFNTDEHVWRDARGHYGRDFLLIDRYMVDSSYGPVPKYLRDNHMIRCAWTGQFVHHSETMMTDDGRVQASMFYQHYVVCQVTRNVVRRTSAVWMEHGAWWSKHAFEFQGGVEVDGKFYARELRNAA
jgi:hypothetical protein